MPVLSPVGQLSPAHLLTLGLPTTDPDESPDAPLSKIILTKVKMTKAGMRDAKLVGVTEVLPASEDGQADKKPTADEDGEERDRENAWVRVCVREALGMSLIFRTR